MKSISTHIILRIALVLALIFQSLMPTTLAIAAEAGYDVSAFICSPSNSAPSAKVQTHIQDLLTILGEEDSKDPSPSSFEHCSNCVLAVDDIGLDLQRCLSADRFQLLETPYLFSPLYYVQSARGPPFGSRAPPSLL